MDDQGRLVFQFFNEIAIINQLSTAMFNKRLPDGLHVSHFSLLNHLVRMGDGKTPLYLSNVMQVSKATMTHTITTLTKRGLVKVGPHETDGRSKVVFLTEEGRAFRQKAIELLGPSIAALSEEIDWSKLESIVPELQKIRAGLDDNRDV